MKPSHIIGIDLGTTNCALAHADTRAPEAPVQQFAIPQLAKPGEVREEPLLPSCLFLHGEADFSPGSIALPWDAEPTFVTGLLAKSRGAEVPHRLVMSAKSWLSHSGVDRTEAILPITADEGGRRVSPVEASRRYLEHLRQAWDHTNPDTPFHQQQVLVTVPASFDAVARELTQRAAEQAGLRDAILLEEPQAAFYSWIERHPDWRDRVRAGDLILVVDVGGGTTDFTLISVTDIGGELALDRMAVGEHILLGGDNMDLALARFVEQQLAESGKKLDAFQVNALWQNCRLAKEKMFAEGETAKSQPVTILGRGTGLIGGSIKAKLDRVDMERIVLDGFFPEVSSHDMPTKQRRAGMFEIGLPYADDAAVTRHLARFLRQQGKFAAPTRVLFNGGVFRAPRVAQRVLAVLNSWLKDEGAPPAVALDGADLMHAVSRGAAYYGLARAGKGVRIRGGIARTYYIGVQAALPAVPGMRPPLRALTVAQFGMEEGTRLQPTKREFGLLTGEPADFRFFASVERKDDEPGLMVDDAALLEELAPIEVTLTGDEGVVVPVTIETEITDTGQLQLWCVARDTRRWKLEFNVRERIAG